MTQGAQVECQRRGGDVELLTYGAHGKAFLAGLHEQPVDGQTTVMGQST